MTQMDLNNLLHLCIKKSIYKEKMMDINPRNPMFERVVRNAIVE